MTRFLLTTVTVVAVLFCASAFSQGPPKQELLPTELAAQNFTFEGVKLGMKIKNFQTLYPDAELMEEYSNAKIDKKTYMIDAKSAKVGMYTFHDDILYDMRIMYTPKQINDMGGDIELYKRLKNKLGKHIDAEYIYKKEPYNVIAVWRFPNVERAIKMEGKDKHSMFQVLDTRKSSIVDALQKKLVKSGFDD